MGDVVRMKDNGGTDESGDETIIKVLDLLIESERKHIQLAQQLIRISRNTVRRAERLLLKQKK